MNDELFILLYSLAALKLWKLKAGLLAVYDALLWVACEMKGRSTVEVLTEIIRSKPKRSSKK